MTRVGASTRPQIRMAGARDRSTITEMTLLSVAAEMRPAVLKAIRLRSVPVRRRDQAAAEAHAGIDESLLLLIFAR